MLRRFTTLWLWHHIILTVLVVGRSVTHIRKSLELELMEQSVNFLKGKLVECVVQTASPRSKRKVDRDDESVLMQIDMDILKYTQQYLMSRVVDCRVRLDHQDRMFSVKSPQIPAITPRPRKPRMPDNLPVANLIYTTTTKATTEMTALELTTENVIETTVKPAQQKVLHVGGKNVTCKEFEVLDEAKVLRCRDLSIEGDMRLPNRDLCPENYNRDDWRNLDDISTTHGHFKVLDLRNLCSEIASSLESWSSVRNVRVSWACDSTLRRLKWLSGSWAGTVLDNGFLHDLECGYNKSLRVVPYDT